MPFVKKSKNKRNKTEALVELHGVSLVGTQYNNFVKKRKHNQSQKNTNVSGDKPQRDLRVRADRIHCVFKLVQGRVSGMSDKRIFRVGLLGFGIVGTGTAKVLLETKPPLIDRTGLDIRLHAIADLDPHRPRPVDVGRARLTTDADSVAVDPEVDIVVEVIGGIEPARSLILKALAAGKSVVTANKKLLARHGRELFEAARRHNTCIGFEAAVCGGVPVIGAVRDGLVGNRVENFYGILNGTTNYILTRMFEEGLDYRAALAEAQAKGFAETDPTDDVAGIDAAHKLTLLANLAFHTLFDFQEVYVEGIADLCAEDIRFARDLGYVVKLLGVAKRRTPGADPDEAPGGVELRVHPTLLPRDHPLAGVREENNAVLIRGDAVGEVMFYGKGAGMMPTGSAIISDIVDAARGAARPTFNLLQFFQNPRADLPVLPIGKTLCRWYARFNVADEPGVLGQIAMTLGRHKVSIASILQHEPTTRDGVPIVILTHPTLEERFRAAKHEIESYSFMRGTGRALRIEG
jgi:homoserine dehydrogenase